MRIKPLVFVVVSSFKFRGKPFEHENPSPCLFADMHGAFGKSLPHSPCIMHLLTVS